MNISIEKKLFALFVLGLSCLAGVGYSLYSDAALRTALQGTGTNAGSAAALVDTLQAKIRDVEAAELGYALSGQRSYLVSYRTASADARTALRELGVLFSGESNAAADAANLTTLVTLRFGVADTVFAARTAGERKKAERLVSSRAGREISGRIGAALTKLKQTDSRISADRGRALGNRLRHGASLLAAGFAVALVVLLLAMALVAREAARHRRLEQTVRDLRDRYHFLTEGLNDCSLCQLGADGLISQWDAAAERLDGYLLDEIRGKPFSSLFPREDAQTGRAGELLKQADEAGRREHIGPRLRKDGSQYHAHTVITPLKNSLGVLRGYSVVTRDITAMKRNEDLLKKLSFTVEQAADLIVITDRDGNVEFVNRAVEEVTGYTREEFAAGGMGLLQGGQQQKLWEIVLAGDTFEAEVTGVRKNGEFIYLAHLVTPIKDVSGRVTHVVFTGTDLTPIRLMRNKLDYLAFYDTLTGLPNRDLFADRLSRDTSGANASKAALAVLAIDIDRFKYINEIYGLDAGNTVLKQVAESLSVSVSKDDTVGRLGSDEFGIILHDIRRPADAVPFVKMIMKNVPRIIMSGGEEISVTLSAGIALYPADGADPRALMKNADTALSKAKGLGRNQFQFYTSSMNEGISEIVFMERRLAEALRNNEYALTFQPYCSMATRKIAGSEVLLTWTNEEFGQVSPVKFIPMLEETGMIIDVGSWVLRSACRQIRDWSQGAALPMAVNLSPSQFRHEKLVETVQGCIQEYGIDPRRLTLEVTESTFVKDQDFAVNLLRRLKALGVCIAIDDFGTGYSSLSYLKKFPVDFVKIDQSFVRDVASDPDTTSLVTAIISMAHGLNLKAVAEGVETEEQWKILRLLKCDLGQGYYFSPALSKRDFENLMA